jgi:hypothetical protein
VFRGLVLGLGLGSVPGVFVGGSSFEVVGSASSWSELCTPCGFGWVHRSGRDVGGHTSSHLVSPADSPWTALGPGLGPGPLLTLALTAAGGTLPPAGLDWMRLQRATKKVADPPKIQGSVGSLL